MPQTATGIYRINDFFDHYAEALERRDTKYMAGCYAMPCTFIADDSSLAYTTDVALEALINQSKRFYAMHNIHTAVPDIRNKRSITDRIVRVTMNWRYVDKEGNTIYQCDYYYIMKLDEHNHWKIEVAIPVNEKQKIDELNAKAAH